jgi:hypothetical protein
VNCSFAELLKEDYQKKNFNVKQRKMQSVLEQTQRTYRDPLTHTRLLEKNKLMPLTDTSSLLENFTGDHKLNNFKQRLQSTTKTRLKLSDYLMSTDSKSQQPKVVLQEQPEKLLIEENTRYHEARRQVIYSLREEVKQQIEQRSVQRRADHESSVRQEREQISNLQRLE